MYRVSVLDWKSLRYIVRHCGLTKSKARRLAILYRSRGEMVMVKSYGGDK